MKERSSLSKMLRAAWLLAWKDTLVRCQMRVTVIFIVVLPLAMTLLMGVALRSFGQQDLAITVAIIDNDQGPVAEQIHQIIEDNAVFPKLPDPNPDLDATAPSSGVSWEFLSDLSLVDARRRVQDGEIDAVIVLPEGLSQQAEANEAAIFEVFMAPGKDEREAVEAGLDRLVQRARQRDPLPLNWVDRQSETSSAGEYNSFAQAVAGNGVMFILLNCMATGGLALVQEKRQNTLSRLLMSPLTPGTIVLGKTLGVVIIGVAQAIVIFGFGLLVGVNLHSVFGIALVTLTFIFVGSALGLTISAIARHEETVQAVCAPIALVMTALGGGMFPLDAAPEWLKLVSLVFPTGWAMDAYHKLIWDGLDWISVMPNVGVLTGFSVLFFVLGIRSLRWD